ncbi:MAG: cupin domain-containing protein [Rikenellaceae bacterium]|nr:cupin domain-containing protein [Rikenellaceae bacterium]
MDEIVMPSCIFSGKILTGERVAHVSRDVGSIREIFGSPEAVGERQAAGTAYVVSSYMPQREGTPGGLCFGITHLYPGKVGDEYYMTKGHYHARIETAEFYWGIEGEGMLILMDRERRVWAERMFPGSLHYIPGGVAHRVANTGGALLSFGACWPSDAGHDYGSIGRTGFAARLRCVDGEPKLVRP